MRTRFKGFSIVPVASLALAMMLPAEAVSARQPPRMASR
jgi:hypothetical protein